MSEEDDKYFSTSDYNKFMSNILDAKITQEKLVNESDLNEKININNKRRNKSLSNKGRIKSTARWNSKTSNVWFKSFYCSKLLS